MKIEELANKYYDRLTSNDHEILDFILKNQELCREFNCEQLAQQCHVSRTTLLRFCRKLNLSQFVELKYLLRDSNVLKNTLNYLDMDKACQDYHKMIDDIKGYSYGEICAILHTADTIYVYGTGNAQKAEAEELKRIFLSVGKCIIDLYDYGEVEFAQKVFTKKDVFLIISLSGETSEGVKILRALEHSSIQTISLTRWMNNSIARMCQNNLYVGTKMLQGYNNFSYEMTAAFYILLDILFVNYLEYIRRI